MKRLTRVQIPLFMAFIVGTSMVAAHFIPRTPFSGLEGDLTDYFNIIAVFAFILGGGNLLRVHLSRVASRHKEMPYSLVTVIGFVVMLVFGIGRCGLEPSQPFDHESGYFFKLYQATFEPLSATMFALLAFFVASAAFRAFRARTLEASLLLGAAFVILIGRTPLGYPLTAWLPDWLSLLRIPELSAFILSGFNTAGQRAIQMGIALGIISTSLKLILGIERSYLGKDEG